MLGHLFLQILTLDSSVNATARDYSNGFNAFMSYARLILSACSKDPLLPGMSTPIPPRHLASLTIQHYLDHIYTCLPFFHEAALHASVDAVYKATTDPHAVVTGFDHWCVRMLLAITNATLSEQRGDQHYMEAVGHVGVALQYAEQVLRPGSITNIQALLFLAEYALVDPHHFDSWSLIGAASRAMVDLGLHQDPPKGSNIARGKLELRRRVFWCVYMLDRSTSIVQTRTFSFSDDSAHVSVPFRHTEAPQMTPVPRRWVKSFSPAADLIKLRQIQSLWYHDLFQSGREEWSDPYPYLWQTYRSMTDWYASISPIHAPPTRSFFQLELLYSYIYFLAPSPRVTNPTAYAQNLIFEHCIAYADLMTRLISGRAHLAPVSFYDAMRVYMTGRQFLDVLNRSQDRLLGGVLPEPPVTAQGSYPPPPLPTSPADLQSNAARSVTCIKQIIECLAHFGLRWGYMSWRDSFEKVAEPMLNSLNQRRWSQEMPPLSGGRRPSHFLHLSSGTVSTMSTLDSLSRQSSNSTIQSSQQPMYGSLVTGPQLREAYNQIYTHPTYTADGVGYDPNLARPSQQSPPLDFQQAPAFMTPGQQFAIWHGMDDVGHPAHTGLHQEESLPPT